jgi:carbon-monoxide dehydrogenase small subunit
MQMSKIKLELTVNEEALTLEVEAHWTLLDVLREQLGLTGSKEGCGEGVCGSCTVLMDGKPVRACLTLALEAADCEIVTVEGLAKAGKLDPLQHAFIDKGSVQCGFCTAGMLMSAKGLLMEDAHPDEHQVRRAISGNVCRCTGYAKIIEAIAAVAESGDAKG